MYMSSCYTIESFGISDLGLKRSNNEDVFHELPSLRFFVLADGMGGHNAGEVAAREVVYHLSTSIHQLFSSSEETKNSLEHLPNHLHKAIQNANLWVHELSEQKAEFCGMGTTLCCLLLHQNSLVYAHVGDSRIYRFRTFLEQLTEDHSLIKKQENSANGKNIITRAIGTTPHVSPDISIAPVEPNDIYFLCSDGLTDFVSDEELSLILQEHSCIKTASKKMIEAAKNKGGCDNITVLMIKVFNELTYISG